MIIKKHYRLSEVNADLDNLYERGITRGVYLGFENLHEFYSMKPSGTTYVYGSPFAGKTEFWFEVLINLSELYGWKHAIYSPESGEAHEIFAEIISKRARKPFYKNIPNHMEEQEYFREREWVNEHFFIIDPKDGDLTIEEFFTEVDALQKIYDVKISTTTCDPFNELKHNFSKDDGRQDLYIENRLGFIRRDSFANHRHNVILTHVADQEQTKLQDGTRYYPPASPRELAGGQAWYRKAMNMICVWRPPSGMTDQETGVPYEDNETHIIIKKYKPKGVGKLGKVKVYFDAQQNRYYEKINGDRRYAGKKPEISIQQQFQIQPNYDA